MQVKRLPDSEKWRFEQTVAVAFECGIDLEEVKANCAKEKTPQEQEDLRKNRTFGAFTDDGSLMFAGVNSREHTVYFDGHRCLLGGIGGVSTLPPYRRQGGIRACMHMALQDMYSSGFDFSFLYPFSMNYYRQYGYEAGGETRQYTVSLRSLKTISDTGTVTQLLPGDDFSPLLEVYRQFYQGYNLSAERQTYDTKLEKANLFAEKRYVYLWKNAAGAPRGLMIARKMQEGDCTLLDCTNSFAARCALLACDVQALTALLSFAKSAFASDYQKIRFAVPGNIDLVNVLGENNDIHCTVFPNGMVRVVRAEDVLRKCRCKNSGSLVVQLTDPVLPENTGTWRITYAPDTENLVEKTAQPPDITLSIGAFSALITGCRDESVLAYWPDITVHRPQAVPENVFYRKKGYMMDLF